MKRMIDTEKFLDKLLYMGYMDEEKSEVEEVANNMTEDAYTKDEVIAMLTELKTEIDEMQCLYVDFVHYVNEYNVSNLIQQKINKLKESEDG